MSEILRITTPAEWDRAVAAGEFRSADLAAEGFIHCSTSEQLPYVYDKFYRDRPGLVVLRVDTERLQSPLKWENPHETLKSFPHVYGPINADAVVAVVAIQDVLPQADS
jgi:uncharacterized protein (DUF952 family)